MKKMKITALLLALIMLLQPVLVSADAAGVSLEDYMGFINNAQNYGLIDSAYEYYVQQLKGKTVDERYQTLKSWHEGLLGDLFYENFIAYYEKAHAGENLICVCGAPCEYGNIAHTNPACQWYFANLPLDEQYGIYENLSEEDQDAYLATLDEEKLAAFENYLYHNKPVHGEYTAAEVNTFTAGFTVDGELLMGDSLRKALFALSSHAFGLAVNQMTLYQAGSLEAKLSESEAKQVNSAMIHNGFKVSGSSPMMFKATRNAMLLNAAATGDMPVWPAEGSIHLAKEASAVEGEEGVFEVTLTIEGKNFKSTSDVVLVLDTSGSMEDYSRYEHARTAALAFGEKLLTEGSTTRIAIVTFEETATKYNGGTFYTDYASFATAINGIYTKNNMSGGTNQQAGLHAADEILSSAASTGVVKNIVILSDGEATFSYPFVVGTASYSECEGFSFMGQHSHFSWSGGLGEVTTSTTIKPDYTTVIGSGSGFSLSTNAYITVTCDQGYTTTQAYRGAVSSNGTYSSSASNANNGMATIWEANQIKAKGTTIYSVALQAGTNGENVLKECATDSTRGYYAIASNETDVEGKLTSAFTAIAGAIAIAASNGAVTDIMGEKVEVSLGTDGAFTSTTSLTEYNTGNYDVYISQGSLTGYDPNTTPSGTLSWNVGNINEGVPAVMKYRIEIKEKYADQVAANDIIDANTSAKFSYKDYQGNDATQTFPVPQISVGGGMILVHWYRVDEDGNPLNENGDVVEDKRFAQVLKTAAYFEEAPGDSALAYNTEYTVSADAIEDYAFYGSNLNDAALQAGVNDVKVTLTARDSNQDVWFAYYEQVAGNLVISKTVEKSHETDVAEIPADAEFTFTVAFSDTASEFSYTKPDGTKATIKSGGTITLTAGQSVKIEGIKAGTTYTVTETPVAGFAAAAAQTGAITAGADATAAFVNVYQVLKTGSITINKTVVDATFTEGERTFTFTVKYSGSDQGKEQFAEWMKDYPDGVVTVTVGTSKTNSVTLSGLPIGSYTVEETPNAAYTTKADGEASYTATASITADALTDSVAFENTRIFMDITVTKVWNDNSNNLGKRPASVTLTVHASSEVQDQTVVLTAENAVDANTNTWSTTLTVPKFDANGNEITYTVNEANAPDFYNKTAQSGLEVTNSVNVGSLMISKKVIDEHRLYTDTVRTFSFKIKQGDAFIQENGADKVWTVAIDTLENNAEQTNRLTVAELQPGKYTVEELPYNGYVATKREVEVTVAAGHVVEAAFENTVKTVNIPVTKTWEDLNDKYKVRPARITVALTAKYADGTAADSKYNKSITIDATTDWKREFQNVAIYDANGGALTYAVTETLAANAEFYTIPEIAGVDPKDEKPQIAITNSIKLGSLTITKTVVDPSGKYADDLTFEFTVTGAHYNEEHTVTVKKTDGYTGSVTIPQLLIGEYTVTETVPGNFTVTANDLTATVAENATATVAFENTVKTFTLTANKTWAEVNGDKSHRPESVTYTLATGDAQFDDTVTIPAETDDTWTAEKANLPVYTEDGTIITYTATETLDEANADFYVLDATSGYDVTATAEDATVSMTNVLKVGNLVIVKVIDDPSATYNASQEFDFTVNGVTKTVTVAAGENTGTTTFENLTIGTYAVTETVPRNYDLTSVTVGNTAIENGGEVAITYDNAPQTTTVTFTNTVKTVDIPVTKIWVDESNKLGTRPDSIDLTLTGKVGETAVVTKTQQLTAANAVNGNANQWEFTFVKLPVYTVDGDLITYTVDEAAVEDYEKSINDYVITNTLLSTTLTITKEGCNETLDAGQSFLFRVKSKNGVDLIIAINGNGTEIISDLLVGDVVTVTEIEGWSWRYTGAAQTITLVDGTNTVKITNTRDNPYWLDGDCYAENNFAVQGN